MSPPPTWSLADLEKQDVSESNHSPTDGATTLADETQEVLPSKICVPDTESGNADELKAPRKSS